MTRRRKRLRSGRVRYALAACAVSALAPYARGNTNDTWKTAATGTWGLNSSWTDNSVPGNGDQAAFDLAGTYTARFDFTPAAIQDLRVRNSGTNVRFETELLSGGPFTLNINAAGGTQSALVFEGASLTLGTSIFTALHLNAGSGVYVEGTLNVTNGSDVTAATTLFGTVNVAATVTVSGGGSTVNCTGAFRVDAGTLAISSGGSVSAASASIGNALSATVTVSGASLWSIAGTLQMSTSNPSFAGSGTLNINGGTVTLGGNITGGVGTGDSTLTLAGGTLDMQNHTIGAAATPIDFLNFQRGTLKNVAQINNGAGLTKTATGMLTLDGTNSYTGGTTISAGTLQIGNGAASGSIVGNVTDNGTIAFNRSDNIGFGGVISGSGNLVKLAANTLTLTAANTYAGVTTVSAGKLVFATTYRTGSGLDVADGATAQIAQSAATPNNVVLKTGSVTTNTSGKLDLTDNKLIVTAIGVGSFNGSAYTGVSGLIQSGRNGGGWGGSGIVTSQSSATSGNFTSIGIATAAQVKAIAATATATWAGQTVTGTDALVMYTYGGDANLDGKINVDDYGHIDSSIPIGLAGWFNGDFNYDGKINVDDYGIIDFNIGIQGAPFATEIAATPRVARLASVPEPALTSLLALTGLLVRTRRQRANPIGSPRR